MILDTLRAATTRLNEEASKQDAELKEHLEKAKGIAAQQLVEEQAHLWIGIIQKERFLRNQALVSLMSRLTHSLLRMARAAELWTGSKSQKQSGANEASNNGGNDEFKKIWKDYRERCDLDLGPKYIAFVDRYRRARNRIVHNGGEANPYLPFDEVDIEAGSAGWVDESFSKNYAEFVHGEGYNAEIDITDELLERCIQRSIELVRHVATQLRQKELASRGRKLQ